MTPLATLVTLAALGSAAVTLSTARSWRTAVQVLLDLLIAAGLIRLVGARSWLDLAGAAVIVALRRLVSSSLFAAGAPPSRGVGSARTRGGAVAGPPPGPNQPPAGPGRHGPEAGRQPPDASRQPPAS